MVRTTRRNRGGHYSSALVFVVVVGSTAAGCTAIPDVAPTMAAMPESATMPESQAGVGASGGCRDAVMNDDETDVDCGGVACRACKDGGACIRDRDCQSARCVSGRCQAEVSCSDRMKSTDETDVDCGGPCAKCALGKHCVAATDCESGSCADNACAAVSGGDAAVVADCMDGKKNATETDVDCGGTSCPACADSRACVASSDCQSKVCQTMTCKAATCLDHVKNGMETEVDCGGGCNGCRPGFACETDMDCARNSTCAAGYCTAPPVLAAVSCSDGVKNGEETGIDCGGPCVCCPNYEIKTDVRNASGWFGGDSTPGASPRSVGIGTSVTVRQRGPILNRFAFYFTGPFKDGAGNAHEVTLVLQIRDGTGQLMHRASVNVPSTFSSGYVFWEKLGIKLDETTYVFTAYVQGALDVGASSGYGGDNTQGYPGGQGYTATVTDRDSSFDDWSIWTMHEWDHMFWLHACPL